MEFKELKERIDTIIDRYHKSYPLDDVSVFKFKARYNQLLRELDFNLATFGIETLIQYLTSWSNRERFGKLEYYSNILANSDPDSRGELFILYATDKINETFVSFLREMPKEGHRISEQNFNCRFRGILTPPYSGQTDPLDFR